MQCPAAAGFFWQTEAVIAVAKVGTMNQNSTPAWSRILVKLSGEALLGSADYGIDPAVLKRIAGDVGEVQRSGCRSRS